MITGFSWNIFITDMMTLLRLPYLIPLFINSCKNCCNVTTNDYVLQNHIRTHHK